ncbi:DUF2007 domain-containing protein [Alkalilimnicola ehrlichii]|uniref:putative signal transducing protein n=1 Tax=Alkalilimnicola ehrlichii TaxID=351052 RepID=UPI003BA0A9A7
MKRVFSVENRMLVERYRQALEDAGIPCQLRNEFLGGGAGELPVNEVWPEIWVADEDEQRARTLLKELKAREADPGPDWTCPRCGETLGGQFDACWNCGALRTEE